MLPGASRELSTTAVFIAEETENHDKPRLKTFEFACSLYDKQRRKEERKKVGVLKTVCNICLTSVILS